MYFSFHPINQHHQHRPEADVFHFNLVTSDLQNLRNRLSYSEDEKQWRQSISLFQAILKINAHKRLPTRTSLKV